MKQATFTDIEYQGRRKNAMRETFLDLMDSIVPWDEWVELVRPYDSTSKRGRPPIEIERMLRMYCLQMWFSLSNPATEDAIYDSYAMCKVPRIDFMTESVPDETTLCKFRHLLEKHHLNRRFFDMLRQMPEDNSLMWQGGTIVDATIIGSTSSTKNEKKERDPEMHQTKKGTSGTTG